MLIVQQHSHSSILQYPLECVKFIFEMIRYSARGSRAFLGSCIRKRKLEKLLPRELGCQSAGGVEALYRVIIELPIKSLAAHSELLCKQRRGWVESILKIYQKTNLQSIPPVFTLAEHLVRV